MAQLLQHPWRQRERSRKSCFVAGLAPAVPTFETAAFLSPCAIEHSRGTTVRGSDTRSMRWFPACPWGAGTCRPAVQVATPANCHRAGKALKHHQRRQTSQGSGCDCECGTRRPHRFLLRRRRFPRGGVRYTAADSRWRDYRQSRGLRHHARCYGSNTAVRPDWRPRCLERKVALDLNQTHTISLFGVQGGGKSYTLGSVAEMASLADPQCRPASRAAVPGDLPLQPHDGLQARVHVNGGGEPRWKIRFVR